MIELRTAKKIPVGAVALIGATIGTVPIYLWGDSSDFHPCGCGKSKRSLASGLVYSLDFLYT